MSRNIISAFFLQHDRVRAALGQPVHQRFQVGDEGTELAFFVGSNVQALTAMRNRLQATARDLSIGS